MFKKNIRGKTLRILLFTSIILALSIAALGLYAMFDLRFEAIESSEELGAAVAASSEEALLSQAAKEMVTLAGDRASLADEKLAAIRDQTLMTANIATGIYSNPQNYAPREISFLVKRQDNVPVPHVRLAEGVSVDSVRDEIALAANVQDILRQITTIESNISESYIGTESKFFISIDKNPTGSETTSYNPVTKEWYEGAKKYGDVFWTDIFEHSSGNGFGISCSAPFYNDRGEIVGVAGSSALLTDVNEIINSTTVGKNGYAFLLNEDGEMIISPKANKTDLDNNDAIDENFVGGATPEIRAMTEKMTAGESGISVVKYEGRELYVAYHPLEITPWSIGLVVAADEIIAPSRQMYNEIIQITSTSRKALSENIFFIVIVFLVIFAVAIIIAIFISFRFSRRLTDPIMELNHNVQQISDGTLESLIDIHTGDEIEQLADSFNTMTIRMIDYMEDLTKVTADKERIATELDVATKIQASLLPSKFPSAPKRFDIFASMVPAREVGGDFYDFFKVDDDTICVVIADVSDKGVPAALFMVVAKTLIENGAQSSSSPKEVFERVNRILCKNNDEGMFVTAFMGYLDLTTGKFTYVNAGHNPPIIRKENGDFEYLETKAGFVLAALDDILYAEDEVSLVKGDVLFLYTDGVTEAMNENNELYGEDRLLLTANKLKGKSSKDFVSAIKDDIEIFTDGTEQSDDITMLLLRYIGGVKLKELVIDATLQNLHTVLDFINEQLDESGCPETAQTQLAVVAEEIFVNIVNYAYTPKTGKVTIRIKADSEVVMLEFEDNGKPYNPLESAEPDITLNAADREIGGLGIHMVRNLTDGMEYNYVENKNRLTIKKIVQK